MVPFYGDYNLTETVNIPFNTFSSDDPSASVTVTNLANGDVYVHQDGVEGTPTGITVSLNVGSVNGNHLAILDLSDTNDVGFYAVGSRYQVRMEGVTVDGATLNAWIGAFSIGCTLRPTVVGRTLDVSAGGEAGIDWANVGSPTTAVALTNTTAKLVDGSIVAATFAADAIAAATFATGALTADAFAADALVAATFATGAFTADAFAADALVAATFATGAFTADAFAADALVAATFATGAFTADAFAANALAAATFAASSLDGKGDWNTVVPATKAQMDAAHALLATPAEVNAQVLDTLATDTPIDGKSIVAALRYLSAVIAGLLPSGAGGETETFKGLDGSTDRVQFTVDDDGNRTAVSYDP